MTSALKYGIDHQEKNHDQSHYHPKYRPDIDGLRTIAVLSVVIFHAFPSLLPGGFIGVDIFFVISGFLISTIIYEDIKKEKFSIAQFYKRRINRIFPALIVVMASCYIFGWFSLFTDEFAQLGKHISGGASFISNILLWDESGYFDTTSDIKPLLHLWSLGIEEQFYIFWPLAIWASWKARVNFLSVTAILLAASFALNIVNIKVDQSATFYLPHTRAWELLIGAALAGASQYRSPAVSGSALLNSACSLIGLGLIAYGLITITEGGSFPGWQAAIPTIGTALIIWGGPMALPNRIILSTKIFVWIGLISFPLYLWHWPLLSFPRIILGETPPAYVRGIAVVAAIVLAVLTYIVIEKPLKQIPSIKKTAILIVVMAVLGATGLFTYYHNGLPNRSAIANSVAFNSQFVGPLWKFAKNDICLSRANFPQQKNYTWWFCITNKDQAPDILVIGTSYANHLYPGLISIPELKEKTILSIGACSIEKGETVSTEPEKAFPCTGRRDYDQRQLIDSIIEKSPSIKNIIIGGLISYGSPEYIQEVKRRIDYLDTKGASITIFHPHVSKSGELKNCYARPFSPAKADCSLDASVRARLDAGFEPLKQEILKSHPDVKFFDQNDVFCNKEKCNLLIDGMPIFRDQYSHFSEYASKKVAERFTEWAKLNGVNLGK